MTKTMQRIWVGLTMLAPKLTYSTIPLVIAMSLVACVMNADKEQRSEPATATQTPGQAPGTNKAAAAAPSAKGSSAPGLGFNLQELSVREERGETTLLVKFSKAISQYRHFTLPQPARIVLDVFGDTERLSQSESFRIDTRWVSGLRFSSAEGSLRVNVEIAAATVPSYSITPDEGGLKITVGAVDPNSSAKKEMVLVKGGKRADVRSVEMTSPSSTNDPKPALSPADEPASSEKNYSGQKISLDFKDADIKNVFRLLAEVSGLNIVVTADVNRRVTIRLVEIPWDQALDLIIDTNGLGKEQVGNVVRISTAGTLKSEKDALIAAKKSKEDLEPLYTVYHNVNYAKVKDLESKVKALQTKRADAALVIDERSNTIMVRDIKKVVDDVNALIGKLDTRTAQVLIESNLIETTPTFSRSLGIQMETLFNKGRVQSSTRFRADPPFNNASLTFFESTTPIFNPASGFSFAYLGNSVAALLSAAEAEGNVKIISRPSVVTLNNVESQIESANIVRIRTGAATVGEAGTLREIRAGITLKVTPQVSADGFVLLNITAKSSTLDFGRTVDGIPQENTREAKANVLVKDGETVVIGGIMKDSSSTSDTGIPYLKDIPVFGWLFKKSSWQKDFEELVVFITPRILAAGSENLPTAEQMWRDQLRQTDGTASAKTPLRP
jgi:type IV pilus secretin PilQ/predicted competence protein